MVASEPRPVCVCVCVECAWVNKCECEQIFGNCNIRHSRQSRLINNECLFLGRVIYKDRHIEMTNLLILNCPRQYTQRR